MTMSAVPEGVAAAAASTETVTPASPAVPAAAADAVKRVPIPPRGVDYRGKVVLAPMVRSGELPSRLLALHYGADLVWGPETVDHSMIGTVRKINPRTGCIEWTRVSSNNVAKGDTETESIIYKVDPVREKGRHIFQIGTNDPDRAVTAARLVAADVDGIDVNAGCPKSFSTTGGMGAALLRKPDLLCSILEALAREIPREFGIGVSVKIRILETPDLTEALVRRLVRTGIHALTVHCRTTPMRPREPAIRGQLKMIRDLCHEAGVACLMNGDVGSREEALTKLIPEFGVDGAMIARAAEKNPTCFLPGPPKTWSESWKENVKRYLRYAMESENKIGNSKFMLTQMVPGKAPEYQKLQHERDYESWCEVLGYKETDPEMMELAKKTDWLLGASKEQVAIVEAEKKRQKEIAAKGKALAKEKERLEKQAQQKQQRQQNSNNNNNKRRRDSVTSNGSNSGRPRGPKRWNDEAREPQTTAQA